MLAKLISDTADDTSEIAIEVLIWLSGYPDRMKRFLEISGVQADEIRYQISKPSFQKGLIAFVMNHEPDLVEFSSERGIPVDQIVRCHESRVA